MKEEENNAVDIKISKKAKFILQTILSVYVKKAMSVVFDNVNLAEQSEIISNQATDDVLDFMKRYLNNGNILVQIRRKKNEKKHIRNSHILFRR